MDFLPVSSHYMQLGLEFNNDKITVKAKVVLPYLHHLEMLGLSTIKLVMLVR